MMAWQSNIGKNCNHTMEHEWDTYTTPRCAGPRLIFRDQSVKSSCKLQAKMYIKKTKNEEHE